MSKIECRTIDAGNLGYIKIVEEKRKITVKVKPDEIGMVKYVVDDENKKVKVDYIPPTSYKLSTITKGKIGETIAKSLLNCIFSIQGDLMIQQKFDYTYDILDSKNNIRYEVKFSEAKYRKDCEAPYWKFYLASKYAREGSCQISPSKRLKDYSTSCDIVLFVGIGVDNSINIFMIPSDSEDITGMDNIQIPVSCHSKYAKYLVDMDTFTSMIPVTDSSYESIENEMCVEYDMP